MSKEKPMGIAEKVPQMRYSAAYPTDAPEEALLSEGSRTKCARRDRKGPRESVSRKDLFTMGSATVSMASMSIISDHFGSH